MKNLKKKMGVSLVALAFFATAGFVSKNAWAVKPNPLYIFGVSEEKNVTKKDSDVTKVVETLKKTKYTVGYVTSDKRFVEFSYSEKEKQYLKLQIYKLDKNGEIRYNDFAVIKDYNLDNLDSQDIVSHVTKYYSAYFPELEDVDTAKFGELSSKTQQEIREKYNKIIKEAPEKLLKEDEVSKRNYKLHEEQKKQKLEKDILEIVG